MQVTIATEAWRVFGLAPDGVLFSPFGHLWPDAPAPLRLWQSVEQEAACPG